MTLKIALFIASEYFGGAEKVFIELANGLAQKHDVAAITIRGNQINDKLSESVKIYTLKSHPTRHNPFQLFELYMLLRWLDPDIIHTHAAKATELVYTVNRLLSKKHLGTKHNDRKGLIFNKIPLVTTVSKKAANSIHLRKDAKLWVIYNGIEEEKILSGDLPEQFTIVAVGRLDRIKGFAELIRQVAPLSFPFRLKIIGEGPEYDTLKSLITQLGAESRVQLMGFRDDVPQQMHDAHVVIISSFSEGGPKVMIEALYYGRAFISTPVGTVPEVLPEQFIVPQDQLGERLEDVYNNYRQYAVEFARVAKEKKPLFIMPEIIRQYDELYHQLVGLG